MSIIPNVYQTLGNGFGPILITLVITQAGIVAMLDSSGNINMLLPSSAGTFSDTSSPPVSSSSPCSVGTFNSQLSIFPCSLCPQGTSTNGLTGQSSCVPCASNAFCPLGAAFGNISSSSSLLTSVSQPLAYPVSPQSIRFDNILMENMFFLRSSMSSHCVLVSPFFWALIAMLLGIIIACNMIILKYCVTSSRGKVTRKYVKRFFKQADIVFEGELWMGGIATFPIFILAIFAYAFSSAYIQRYPIEQVNSEASFACDPTLMNAQFSSGLMSLAIAPNDDAAPMFNLLDDAQPFTLHVDLVNTIFRCDDLTLTQIKGVSLTLDISACDDNSGSLSFSALLPSHGVNLQLSLTGIEIIGGFRLGLTGPGSHEENETLNAVYTLVDLDFGQTFSIPGQFLSQQPLFTVQLTKLINRTYPIDEDGETAFSAMWTAYIVNTDENFVDENEYKYEINSGTTISIVISETPYYISNTQRPITDQAELIFTDLLFTIVCIEVFGLLFLIFKLGIIPLTRRLWNCRRRRTETEKSPENFDETSSYHF
jgi:hypothetical protein